MGFQNNTNQDQFLFPLRRERDRLIGEMLVDATEGQRKAIEMGARGDLLKFTNEFEDRFGFKYRNAEQLYTVLLKIKHLEAELYDEAMKRQVA